MSEVMVETLEGLGMVPMLKDFEDGPIRARPMPRIPLSLRRFPADDEHTPPRPMPLPGHPAGNTGIIPPWFWARGGSPAPAKPLLPIFEHTPPKLLPLPLPVVPGNTGIVPPDRIPAPKASDIVTMDTPTYQKPVPVDEETWTPPDDAVVQDQWGLDQGVDAGLKDDLYASQDFQADGEGESNDGGLWGLGDAWDVIPNILPDQPTAAPAASSNGFLNTLSSFLTTTLPTAAQVYASVQATKTGNPMIGAQVAQQAGARPMVQQGYPTTPNYGPGVMPGGYPGAPSWFSQRTILSNMSNGAVVGIAAAAAVALLVVLKKHKGA